MNRIKKEIAGIAVIARNRRDRKGKTSRGTVRGSGIRKVGKLGDRKAGKRG